MPDEDVTITDAADIDTDRVDEAPAEKKDWRAEFEGQRKVNRDLERKLKEQFQKLEDLGKAENKDSADPEKVREQARAEVRAEVLKERALDKIEAKAAKLFADPEDARALLAGQVDDFVYDGKLDVDAITDALDELLKKKPHLAATAAPRFNGSADGGARKGSGKPSQLTEQDLKRMTPDQIVDARKKGQLDELMGVS